MKKSSQGVSEIHKTDLKPSNRKKGLFHAGNFHLSEDVLEDSTHKTTGSDELQTNNRKPNYSTNKIG